MPRLPLRDRLELRVLFLRFESKDECEVSGGGKFVILLVFSGDKLVCVREGSSGNWPCFRTRGFCTS